MEIYVYKIVPKVLWNEFLVLIDFFFLIFRSLFDVFISSTFRGRFDRMMVVHMDFRFFRAGFISTRRGIRSSLSSERSIWITVFLCWRSGVKFRGAIGFWAIKIIWLGIFNHVTTLTKVNWTTPVAMHHCYLSGQILKLTGKKSLFFIKNFILILSRHCLFVQHFFA